MIIKDTKFKRIQLMTSHGIPIYPKTMTTAVWDFDRNKSLNQILDELNPVELTKVEVVELLGSGDLTDTLSFELTNEYIDGSGYFIDINGEQKEIEPIVIFSASHAADLEMSSATIIRIPEGVELIGDRAFAGYSNLLSLILPRSTKAIGSEVFDSSIALLSIELRSPLFVGVGGNILSTSAIQLKVPANLINLYKNNEFWALIHHGNVVALTEEPKSKNDTNTIYYEGKPFYPITKTSNVIHSDGRNMSDIIKTSGDNVLYRHIISGDSYTDSFMSKGWIAPPRLLNFEILIRTPLFTKPNALPISISVYGGNSIFHKEEITKSDGNVYLRNYTSNLMYLTPQLSLSQAPFYDVFLSTRMKVSYDSSGRTGGMMETTSTLTNSSYNYIFDDDYMAAVKVVSTFSPMPYDPTNPMPSEDMFKFAINNLFDPSNFLAGTEIIIYNNGPLETTVVSGPPETDLGYYLDYYTQKYTIFGFDDPAFKGTVFDPHDELNNTTALWTLSAIEVKFPNGTTEIADGAFPLSMIQKIILPPSVKRLGAYSLYAGGNLDVHFSEGLEIIDRRAIVGHSSKIPAIIPSTVTEIGDGGFAIYESNGLFFANPETSKLTKIGDFAFNSWMGVKSLYLPDNLKEIGVDAFSMCHDLLYLRLPPNLEIIRESAFLSCDSLTRVEIPPKIKELPDGCFSDCAIKEVIFNDGLETIGDLAFATNQIEELNFPSTLQNIGVGAFAGAFGGLLIRIPENVKIIERRAFWSASFVKEIYLGTQIISIKDLAFDLCPDIERFEIRTILPPTIGYNSIYSFNPEFKLFVPAESVLAYKDAPGWENYRNYIFAL